MSCRVVLLRQAEWHALQMSQNRMQHMQELERLRKQFMDPSSTASPRIVRPVTRVTKPANA